MPITLWINTLLFVCINQHWTGLKCASLLKPNCMKNARQLYLVTSVLCDLPDGPNARFVWQKASCFNNHSIKQPMEHLFGELSLLIGGTTEIAFNFINQFHNIKLLNFVILNNKNDFEILLLKKLFPSIFVFSLFNLFTFSVLPSISFI
jgi:hypothetical protein